MIRENIDRVFKGIVAFNMRNDTEAIPHSDDFIKQMESQYGFSQKELEIMIDILKESHKILVMEISREDKVKKVDKILGYVDADLVTVTRLKNQYFRYLQDEYEKDTGKKKTAGQIIKELIPRLQYINNMPMGRLLNKTMMIDEFERLLEKEYKNYTEEYKEENLLLQIDINKEVIQGVLKEKSGVSADETDEEESEEIIKADNPDNSKRAVDSPQYKDFVEHSNEKSVRKLLSIYGVDFFYRVNLRKKKFQYLREVLASGVLDRKKDLVLLKDMLKKIKANLILDKELQEFHQEILSLDRELSRAINFCKK